MSAIQIGQKTIPCSELPSLLAGYRLLPHLVRELIIDQAIAAIECTAQEQSMARQQFLEQQKITTEAERQAWLNHHGMTLQQLEALAIRGLKIEKFKQTTWGSQVESHFLAQKSKLNQAIYSLIRTQDSGLAQELYFRLQAGEQSFAELASQYSQGPEAQTGGLLGPVALSQLHPDLAQVLMNALSGQLCPLLRLDNWIVIVRLEQFIPAQLNSATRQALLNHLFETWIQQTMSTEQWSICTKPEPPPQGERPRNATLSSAS